MIVMSAATGLPYGRPLVKADLADMPEDGHRYELIDGTLIVSPAPKVRHQRVVRELMRLLLPVTAGELELFTAPLDVVLADDTVIQPDLLIVRSADLTEHEMPGAPVLAVEVLSPSTRGVDLLLKKERLERAGCAHYWVVDPDEPAITAWSLDANGRYGDPLRASGTEEFRTEDPVSLTVRPQHLIDS